jgi:hypothetical protein
MRRGDASQSVSFRLSGRALARLTEQAKASNQSLGNAARARLTAALDDEDPLRVFAEIQALRRDLAGAGGSLEQLRVDLAATLEVVLLNVTKGSAEEVRSWIEQHLRR